MFLYVFVLLPICLIVSLFPKCVCLVGCIGFGMLLWVFVIVSLPFYFHFTIKEFLYLCSWENWCTNSLNDPSICS